MQQLQHSELGRVAKEYVNIEYERIKECLVTAEDPILRGKAQELRALKKIFSPKS